MAAPSPNWSTVTVYGTYRKLDGMPIAGTLKFSVSTRVSANTDDVIFPEGSSFTVTLDDDGTGTVDLPAVDDPDNSPSDWSIKVEESLIGLQGRTYYIQPRLAHLELDPPGLNLRTIVLDDTNSKPTVAQQKGVPGGVAALNDAGKVIDSDGNVVGGGSGVGTVTSVAGVEPVDGDVAITPAAIGLDQVDNTHDANKQVASAAKWATGRTYTFTGDVSGAFTTDGSSDQSIEIALEGGGDTGNALIAAADQTAAWNALGTTPVDKLPPNAIVNAVTVADQTARLTLIAQQGDVAKQTDNQVTYILTNNTPGVDANWMPISVPALVASVAGKTGAVTLAKADVGLDNADNTADTAKAVLSATKLATPRTINGVNFDGSANITVPSTDRVLYGTAWPGSRPVDGGRPLQWDDTAYSISAGADTAGPDESLLHPGDYWWTYTYEGA